MTTTQRPRPPRQAPHGPNPASRGLILVVVAVVLGAILLIKGGGVGFETDSTDVEIGTGTDQPATEESTVPTTAAPSTSVPKEALKIVVLNGAGVNGYAAAAKNFFGLAGYPNATADTAAQQVQTTAVYYAPGYEGDAQAIATLLSIGAPQPLPVGTNLGKTAEVTPADTGVVVVLGPDVQGIISPAGAGTTTTVAGGATATTVAGAGTASTIPATSTTKG
ncbi:hypothetical protein BH10ACT3_BH10ACT3_17000 [soil metagenome]